MEIFCIIYIIIGSILAVIGLIATIICFSCPIEHMWTVPLLLLGIFLVFCAYNKLIDIKVNEALKEKAAYKIEIEEIKQNS